MFSCPDCGEMVMKGDPYCTHCGAHLNWVEDNASYDASSIDIESAVIDMHLNRAKRKLEEFYSAKDVIDLSTRPELDALIIMVTRKNRYVETVDEFVYERDYVNPRRIFRENHQIHIHKALLADEDFKTLIRNTGMELVHVIGGYVTEYNLIGDEFKMIDKVDVRVVLEKDGKRKSYNLDLDNMKLKEPEWRR